MGYIIVTKTPLHNIIVDYLRSKDNYPPYDKTVVIEKTNLPVVYITVDNITRDDQVIAHVKIIDNERVDYDGEMAIRYRGHASYKSADKKSYALRPLDDLGEKTNVSLLGMKSNKKWALKANWIDQSMIREAIAYELASHTEVAAPQMRFVEVILNDVYYGVYSLMEQPTRRTLGLTKTKGDVSGSYLLYFSRMKEADFIAENKTHDNTFYYPFIIKHPDFEDLTTEQKKYINDAIIAMSAAVKDTSSLDYGKYINELSFIDYQLSSEFACNTDAYWGSGYIYKDNDDIDGRFRMCLWDGDHAFGMSRNPKYSWYNHWIYRFKEDIQSDHRYDWWIDLMKNPRYQQKLQDRWKWFRCGYYSDDRVFSVVDSLYHILNDGGAVERNNKAWHIWGKEGNNVNHPHEKYLSDSFEDEIQYVKDWIRLRLEWMDNNINESNGI